MSMPETWDDPRTNRRYDSVVRLFEGWNTNSNSAL